MTHEHVTTVVVTSSAELDEPSIEERMDWLAFYAASLEAILTAAAPAAAVTLIEVATTHANLLYLGSRDA
jgi:hypothetical protein